MSEDEPHAARPAAETDEEEFSVSTQAAQELCDGLLEALALYSPANEPLTGSETRDWACSALSVIISFIGAHDELGEASLPLLLLRRALYDLDNGHQAAMLRPRAAGNRPKSSLKTRLRVYAAGIVGGLMKHTDMTRNQAAEYVSKKLRAAGHEVASGTVIDWRRDVLSQQKSPMGTGHIIAASSTRRVGASHLPTLNS